MVIEPKRGIGFLGRGQLPPTSSGVWRALSALSVESGAKTQPLLILVWFDAPKLCLVTSFFLTVTSRLCGGRGERPLIRHCLCIGNVPIVRIYQNLPIRYLKIPEVKTKNKNC